MSTAFEDGGVLPVKYSRRGGDVSPPLTFSDVPESAESLALICHDPDAPRVEGWTHWVVWNVPANVSGFAENKIPADAVQGRTDYGENHWGGPQPPSGTHRYIFYLYALDSMLELPSSTTREQLEVAMNGHVFKMAMLTGLFSA